MYLETCLAHLLCAGATSECLVHKSPNSLLGAGPWGSCRWETEAQRPQSLCKVPGGWKRASVLLPRVIKHLPRVPYTPYPIYGFQYSEAQTSRLAAQRPPAKWTRGLQNVNAAPQDTLGPGQRGPSRARGHCPGAILETANLQQPPGLPARGSALTCFPAEAETQANQLAPAFFRPHSRALLTWGDEACQPEGLRQVPQGGRRALPPPPPPNHRQECVHSSARPLSPPIYSFDKHLSRTYCVLSPGLDKPAPPLQSGREDRGTKAEADEGTVTGRGPRRTMRRRPGGHRRPAEGFTCQCTGRGLRRVYGTEGPARTKAGGRPHPRGQLSCHPGLGGHEWVFHGLDQGKVRPSCSLLRPGLLTV